MEAVCRCATKASVGDVKVVFVEKGQQLKVSSSKVNPKTGENDEHEEQGDDGI